ncbi:hypothetical protein ACFOGJ_24255 [Marinibaculum pumilum]|uniref:Uncharacterized protein n=1 Tax=Marinibaculum pumilum TaxID=1766165 RepID=A0ABV7L703_9PROT
MTDRIRMRLPAALEPWLPVLSIGLRLLCTYPRLPQLPARNARLWVPLTEAEAHLVSELQALHEAPQNAIVAAALLCAQKAPPYSLPPDFVRPMVPSPPVIGS